MHLSAVGRGQVASQADLAGVHGVHIVTLNVSGPVYHGILQLRALLGVSRSPVLPAHLGRPFQKPILRPAVGRKSM